MKQPPAGKPETVTLAALIRSPKQRKGKTSVMDSPAGAPPLEAALALAANGWHVLPLHGIVNGACTCKEPDCDTNAGKHPRTLNGKDDATTDPETIRTWWRRWPSANIGVSCRPSGLLVLDVDPQHGGSVEALATAGVDVDTLRASTGGGGVHLLYRCNGQRYGDSPGRLPGGVDVRGAGYFVAPPSLHRKLNRYRWDETHPLRDIPPRLAELLDGGSEKPAAPFTAPGASNPRAYALAALQREVQAVRGTPAGSGSHNTRLNEAAYALLRPEVRREVGWRRICEQLYEASVAAGETPAKTQSTLNSALNGRSVNTRNEPSHVDPAAPADPPANGTPGTTPERQIKLTRACDIQPRPVRWLWADRLPLGGLSLLGGREGIGKSAVAYDLAADVSRGRLAGQYGGRPRSVLVIATEDSWEHTIVPRLMAAGADRTRILRAHVVTRDLVETTLSLPVDLDGLEETVKANNVALILLDPLLSRLDSKLDTHKDSQVRLALEPLVAVAQRTDSAILGLIHVNKSRSTDPLTLLMASRAFAAVARAVLFCMSDPDADGLRLLGQPKNNLGSVDLPTLSFRIEGAVVADTDEGPVITARIRWEGEDSRSISDALEASEESGEGRTAVGEAKDWLDDYMTQHGGTSVPSADIKKAGHAVGHSETALRRARAKLKITTSSVGYPRQTFWSLPPGPSSSRVTPQPGAGVSVGSNHDPTQTNHRLSQARASRVTSGESDLTDLTDSTDGDQGVSGGSVASVGSVGSRPPRATRLSGGGQPDAPGEGWSAVLDGTGTPCLHHRQIPGSQWRCNIAGCTGSGPIAAEDPYA